MVPRVVAEACQRDGGFEPWRFRLSSCGCVPLSYARNIEGLRMLERYTEKARRVIFFARYEASNYGSPYIETEHLLLGLI